jgi:hypothetical protein
MDRMACGWPPASSASSSFSLPRSVSAAAMTSPRAPSPRRPRSGGYAGETHASRRSSDGRLGRCRSNDRARSSTLDAGIAPAAERRPGRHGGRAGCAVRAQSRPPPVGCSIRAVQRRYRRDVAQLGQRTCFGSRGSPVQIRPSRPACYWCRPAACRRPAQREPSRTNTRHPGLQGAHSAQSHPNSEWAGPAASRRPARTWGSA